MLFLTKCLGTACSRERKYIYNILNAPYILWFIFDQFNVFQTQQVDFYQ